MNYIFGTGLIIIGVLMVLKTEWLVLNFGRIYWFDKHLGTEGGTRLGYKIIAIIIILFGILNITGLHVPFLNWLLSPLMTAGI